MAKRKLTQRQREMLAVNQGISDQMFASFVVMACANACVQLLTEKYEFTTVKAKAFIDEMIPLAVSIGAGAMGVTITPTAEQLAIFMEAGIQNAEKIEGIAQTEKAEN